MKTQGNVVGTVGQNGGGTQMGWVVALVVGLVFVAGQPVGWADEPGLQAEIELLKARLERLEARLTVQRVVAPAVAGGAGISLPSGLQGIEISGFVDTAYSYNFNEPKDQVNDGRVFDTTANSFVLNNFQLNVEKGVDEVSPVGFKTSLMFGDDAEGTHSAGLFTGTDSIDIQQAYVEYLVPVGEGLDLTFGKQATLIGAEVIESIDNWNYSRAYLFGLAIPFTHTGVRASYPLSETLTFTGGINNGWDIADDTNIGKGVEYQLAWQPNEDFFISYSGMFSPETSSTAGGALITDKSDRWIHDIVATYQVNPELAVMLNYDLGFQQDVGPGAAPGVTNDNSSWQGVGLYAKYQLSDTCSLAGRYEFFRDHDTSRTPSSFSGSGQSDLSLQEFTLTGETKLAEHLIARLEYRHDMANGAVFGHNNGELRNYQDTVAIELIMPF